MMKEITVLAFGAITDIIGNHRLVVTGVESTDDLTQRLEAEFPALKDTDYTVAVNKRTITRSTVFDNDATVALLPPFSGG